jgi:hypothetical protein
LRWWFILALQFGMSVASLKAMLPASELPYWFALYELDPWGEQRADFRQAITTTAIANTMGGGKAKPADFMAYTDEEKKKQTPEEQEACIRRFAKAATATKNNVKRSQGAKRGKDGK